MKFKTKYCKLEVFLLKHKLNKTSKKATDEELIDLYESYLPYRDSQESTENLKFMLAEYTVVSALRKRYPNNTQLQNYTRDMGVNLRGVIR